MTVYVRILLYILTGYMLDAGWISAEIKSILTTDPEIAAGVQVILASVVGAVALGWRWVAKRLGWST